ncbi:hypothetical protein NDU88_005680 [Pleurodeles waltl]|uniref:Uncharacterized protein n=1 Tax=Pleurodeles waltl TaxID=8319 RepID=A0AAV7NN25_PLEWA|nr:hypothetical protein NDU88_005680 [Pleurodeles waltl]
MTLYETKPIPRLAQFEALAEWELIARQQQEIKFQRRIRKVEKSLAEARWDWEQKKWRMATLQGVKLFPAIKEEDESEGKEETSKSNKSSSGGKKKKRTYVEDEDSDVEDLIEGVQVLVLLQLPQHKCRGQRDQCKQIMESDDKEEQAPESENETINEEYPLIEFFPMLTVKELHADLQGIVQENV